MKLTITIDTSNAAFEGWPQVECARILRAYAEHLEAHDLPDRGDPDKLMDINGNTVGEAKVR